MKNLFSSAISFVKDRSRLIIEYALIAAIVTLAGFTAAMWSQKTKLRADLAEVSTALVTTQGKVATLEFSKSIQDKTIADLKVLRDLDNVALQGLQTDYAAITKKDTGIRNRLNELEKKDAPTHNYLDSPVPPKLRCMLNNTACPADTAR